MCGLFGSYGPVPRKLTALKALCVLNSDRGTDSAGIAGIDADGSYRLYKRPTTPVTVSQSAQFKSIVRGAHIVIGHTRYATHGTVSQRNAHPFRSGRTILAHNGVCSNHAVLQKKYDSKHPVDSQTLAMLIDQTGTIEDATGSLNLTYWQQDRPDVVRLVRCNNPLTLIGNGEWFLWSSLEDHAKYAAGIAGIADGDYSTYTFKNFCALEIRPDNVYSWDEGKVKELGSDKRYSYSAGSYSNNYSHYSSTATTTTKKKIGGKATTKKKPSAFKVPKTWTHLGTTIYGTEIYETMTGELANGNGRIMSAGHRFDFTDGRSLQYSELNGKKIKTWSDAKKNVITKTKKRPELIPGSGPREYVIPSNYIYLGTAKYGKNRHYATPEGMVWMNNGLYQGGSASMSDGMIVTVHGAKNGKGRSIQLLAGKSGLPRTPRKDTPAVCDFGPYVVSATGHLDHARTLQAWRERELRKTDKQTAAAAADAAQAASDAGDLAAQVRAEKVTRLLGSGSRGWTMDEEEVYDITDPYYSNENPSAADLEELGDLIDGYNLD